MLNVGWVPADKKSEISTDPVVEPFEFPANRFEVNEGYSSYSIQYNRQDAQSIDYEERR